MTIHGETHVQILERENEELTQQLAAAEEAGCILALAWEAKFNEQDAKLAKAEKLNRIRWEDSVRYLSEIGSLERKLTAVEARCATVTADYSHYVNDVQTAEGAAMEELQAKLAAAEALLAVEKHENDRWEVICQEMQAKLAAAEARCQKYLEALVHIESAANMVVLHTEKEACGG